MNNKGVGRGEDIETYNLGVANLRNLQFTPSKLTMTYKTYILTKLTKAIWN